MMRLHPPAAHAGCGHWMAQALDGEPAYDPQPLAGEIDAEVCIVGGGFTGLWTALELRRRDPSADVVLLEADVCGAGASGRNGGMALSWWPKLETLVKRVGAEEALRLGHAAEEAIAELGAFCEREGIDAEFRQAGWLWTATSDAQRNAWIGALRTCEQHGVTPFHAVGADELRERLGSPIHRGGVFEASGATVQPAKLARGLRRAALAHGVRLHERTPVVELDRATGVLRTPGGVVRARTVVLATNAWLAAVPELRRAIVPLSSDVVATAPMAEQLADSGWVAGESVSNSRLMVHYYRTTADGRVVFGRGGGAVAFRGAFGARFDHHEHRGASVAADLCRMVPAAQGVPVVASWGGAVDRSDDGLPFFGRLAGAAPVFYGAGFSGNGVAPTLLAGRILASLARGDDDEWAASGLARGVPGTFPPEPVRFLGALLVKGAVQRKELREDRGAPVDQLTRRLAALAPSGFFKVTEEEER